MVTICTRLRQAPEVRAIAEAHDGVFWAAGTHPMHAAEEPLATVEALVALAGHPKFVGIGETGLDYHYTADSAAIQQESLRLHVEAARRDRPAARHPRPRRRRATSPASSREEHAAGPFACVMHCFTSGRALAETALALGFYLSISGIATFRSAEDLRAIFARRAARPAARRDRQPLPRAGPPPRQAQRARLHRRHRAGDGAAPRHGARGARRASPRRTSTASSPRPPRDRRAGRPRCRRPPGARAPAEREARPRASPRTAPPPGGRR